MHVYLHKDSYVMYETNKTLRDRNLKAILTLIPGTPEQMQAEMATLKKSIKKIQIGLGGPTIPVPECPVKNKLIHLMSMGIHYCIEPP